MFIATKHFSNVAGIGIISIDPAAETVYTAFTFGEKIENARRVKIHYTSAGRAFFRRYNVRYYIDQFIRTGV